MEDTKNTMRIPKARSEALRASYEARWQDHMERIINNIKETGTIMERDQMWLAAVHQQMKTGELPESRVRIVKEYYSCIEGRNVTIVKNDSETLSEKRWNTWLLYTIESIDKKCGGDIGLLLSTDVKAANWIYRQRNLYRNGLLPEEHRRKMETAGIPMNRERKYTSGFSPEEEIRRDCKTFKAVRIKYGSTRNIPKEYHVLRNRIRQRLTEANHKKYSEEIRALLYDALGSLENSGTAEFTSELVRHKDGVKRRPYSAVDKSADVISKAVKKYGDIEHIPDGCVGRYIKSNASGKLTDDSYMYFDVKARAYQLMAKLNSGKLSGEKARKVKILLGIENKQEEIS